MERWAILIGQSNTMRKLVVLTCASFTLAAIALFGVAYAQSGRRLPSENQQGKGDTLQLRAEEVLLNVTVIDSYNRQATDLRKTEFIVSEDNIRQEIASFAVSSVPVNVALLLDASGSVITEISSIAKAASHFVDQLGPEDKVSVLEFHSKVELLQDWTSNHDDLRHAISWRFKPGAIPRSGGNTALYDAVYLTAEEQLAKVEGRKAIIILTDGDDTSSKVTYDQCVAASLRSGALVYVVSKAQAMIAGLKSYRSGIGRVFGPGRQADAIAVELEHAEQLMTDISNRTGGRIYSPLKDDEMNDIYGRVAHELKNQYIITYIPKNEERDGRFRRVGIYLTRPGYVARTREGYYAPKPRE